jgi:hypothetical protein
LGRPGISAHWPLSGCARRQILIQIYGKSVFTPTEEW